MSGLFLKGEKKERAGVYRRHEQITNNGVASAMNGVFVFQFMQTLGRLEKFRRSHLKPICILYIWRAEQLMQQQPYLVLEQTLYIYTALELAEKRKRIFTDNNFHKCSHIKNKVSYSLKVFCNLKAEVRRCNNKRAFCL